MPPLGGQPHKYGLPHTATLCRAAQPLLHWDGMDPEMLLPVRTRLTILLLRLVAVLVQASGMVPSSRFRAKVKVVRLRVEVAAMQREGASTEHEELLCKTQGLQMLRRLGVETAAVQERGSNALLQCRGGGQMHNTVSVCATRKVCQCSLCKLEALVSC